MTINRQWHQAHRLPRSASFEERLEWHRQHAAHCGCREPPPAIRLEIEKRAADKPRTPEKVP